jgi:FKBP-type peptidyl-prolyl cis-trans isomerase SlyD
MYQQIITRKVTFCLLFCALFGACTILVNAQEQTLMVSTGVQVSIEYTLKLDDKEVFTTNVGSTPLTYVHGTQHMVPGLEKALEGMKIGEHKQVTVPPTEGYGAIKQEAIIEVDKDKIPSEAHKVGSVVQGRSANGQPMRARVTELKDNSVILDFNHPLAGKTLYFDIKVLDIQQAPDK